MKYWNKTILALVSTAVLSPSLLAQQRPGDEQDGPRHYTVELVVFTYEEDVGLGSEIFPPDLPLEPFGATDDADTFGFDQDDAKVELRGASRADPADLEFEFLSGDQFTLTDVVQRLERLDAYDPVMHVGWTQAGIPQDASSPIELSTFRQAPADLRGSFTLYLGRFLHLIVDVEMDAPAQKIDVSFEDSPSYQLDARSTRQGPVYYRIREDRIIRNGETRYYDHPKFGIVAKVTRVEEASESGSDPLIGRSTQ